MATKIIQLEGWQAENTLTAIQAVMDQTTGISAYFAVRAVLGELRRQIENQPDTEVWYKIEWSHKGANDWYALGSGTLDSIEGARDAKRDNDESSTYSAAFDYRIVKVTAISEVVE